MASPKHLVLDPNDTRPPTIGHPSAFPSERPNAKATKTHPSKAGNENASIYFVGTATTIMEWEGIRIMTDPNFLHNGDHVHLGPGVGSVRRTNPAVDLDKLPRIDAVLLSHYHGDHFDQKVEASLRRDLPIITTPHARSALTSKGPESFTAVYDLAPFQEMNVDIKGDADMRKRPSLRVTGTPGKHVPPTKPPDELKELFHAVPPTNGWMLEFGYTTDNGTFASGYCIYITGDTLLVDEVKEIPQRFPDKHIDLMLAHLGGTTLPSPSAPVTVMVTMDAKQGVELMRCIRPDVTLPIHNDDYEVFVSSLEDFRNEVEQAGLQGGVVYLDRGEEYRFRVKG
ncbi:hypothetical protein FE257_008910 [Aspergillus nanangensis]|uniref:Metallo-beta-lactamase domain-containing protein n=1 Tax=Aspergillus nanangensis TaxID=2582783 RepID=A0AAD4GXL4_ASPNN|nr:hypothetical protein FE257_008910 [Aspergillus nanangensis]